MEHGCLVAGMGAQDRTPGTEQMDTDKDNWNQKGALPQSEAALTSTPLLKRVNNRTDRAGN